MTTDTDIAAPGEALRRDWLLASGMVVVGIAAAASSFAGLRDLAERTGWLEWLTWLLPLTVDAYAMTATRVWLAASTRNDSARAWAKANAIGAITVSVGGNAIDHALAERVIAISWPLIVAVSAIPPVVLGLLVHLAHLRALPPAADTLPGSPAADDTRQPAASPATAPPPSPAAPPAAPAARQPRRRAPDTPARKALPPGKSDDELIAAARERHASGTEPSATWLTKEFGIGTRRAARIRDAALADPATADSAPETQPASTPEPDDVPVPLALVAGER